MRTRTSILTILFLIVAASLALSMHVAQAQEASVTVTWQLSANVIGDATGTILTVDGRSYNQSQLSEGLAFLNETAGSAGHTVLVTTPIAAGPTKRYVFSTWTGPPLGVSASSPNGTFAWPTNSSTVTANYVTQYLQTLSYSVIGGGTPSAPSFTADQLGSPFSKTLTDSATGYYFDSGSSWTVSPNLLAGSGNSERWQNNQTPSGTISEAQTLNITYYHQFSVNFTYTVVAGGSPASPTVDFTQYGSFASVNASASPGTQGWVDSGSTYSYTNPLNGSTTIERWDTDSATASISATVTVNPSFYHQFLQMLSYQITGGGTGYSAPSFTANQFEVLTRQMLNTTASGYWFDDGGLWTVTNPLGGSTGSERWFTSDSSGTVTAAQPLAFAYSHQFHLAVQVDPPGGGSISPNGFFDDGAVTQIYATANPGYAFKNWTGLGAGSFTGRSNPASVTMSAAITETAFFISRPPVSITVTSDPTGPSFLSVDGKPIVTPQTYSWIPGTNHTIAASSPVRGGTGVQYVWQSWSDGDLQSHTITVPSSSSTLTATFQQQYQLTINATTGGTTDPPPGSHWYYSGQSVSVTAMANSGYDFSNWLLDGRNAGLTNQLAVTMSRAHTVVGNFEQEPSPICLFFTTTLGRIVAIISGLFTIIGSIYGVRRYFKQKSKSKLTTLSVVVDQSIVPAPFEPFLKYHVCSRLVKDRLVNS